MMRCENCNYYDEGTGFCFADGDGCVAERLEDAREYAEEMEADAEREDY